MKRDKIVCVVHEKDDALVFDCDANCESCPFENEQECLEYQFTDKEKLDALKKYIAKKGRMK